MHDGVGETLLYMNLIEHMPQELTVYAIEPHGNGRCPILHLCITDMAAHYVSQIHAVCPDGPYFIGGMCGGGTIAFEMALQLGAQGNSVGLVVAVRSVSPQARQRPHRTVQSRWTRFQRGIEEVQGSRWERLVGQLVQASKKIKGVALFELSERPRRLTTGIRFRMLRKVIDRGQAVPRYRAVFRCKVCMCSR